MDLLLDTHVLVWFAEGDARLGAPLRDAIVDPDNRCLVSAVTAFEYADLRSRGRFLAAPPLGELVDQLDGIILRLPAAAWQLIPLLPDIHRDPVDRMLVAHAIHADLTLVTADEKLHLYPVRTLPA